MERRAQIKYDDAMLDHELAMDAHKAGKKREVRSFWAEEKHISKRVARQSMPSTAAASSSALVRTTCSSSTAADSSTAAAAAAADSSWTVAAVAAVGARPSGCSSDGQSISEAQLTFQPRMLEKQREHPKSFGTFCRRWNVSDAYR